ncbi:hypothetical protein BH20VER3_BH20VER3_04010 [soil metagenome]
MDRRQMDRFHETISRLIAGQNFSSAGEVNEFLQKQLKVGALDWDALGPGPEATPLARAQDLFY